MARYLEVNASSWPGELPHIGDLRHDKTLPFVRSPEEYDGSEKLKLCCTQISGLSGYQQKKVTDYWAKYLSVETLPLKFVQCCTSTPQQIFDALCTQDSIEVLRLKWARFANLSAIRNLKNLRSLQIDLGSSISDLTPLGELKNLQHLSLGDIKKTRDYSALGNLSNLEALHIGVGMWNWLVEMDCADFLLSLPKLNYLSMGNVRVANADALFQLNMEQFKYLCVRLEDDKI